MVTDQEIGLTADHAMLGRLPEYRPERARATGTSTDERTKGAPQPRTDGVESRPRADRVAPHMALHTLLRGLLEGVQDVIVRGLCTVQFIIMVRALWDLS